MRCWHCSLTFKRGPALGSNTTGSVLGLGVTGNFCQVGKEATGMQICSSVGHEAPVIPGEEAAFKC